MPQVRLDTEAHERLLRLAKNTGMKHEEIITKALNLYEFQINHQG